MNIFKYLIAGCAAGITLSGHACTILEFGAENLLNSAQNTPEINFQELEAFAAGLFSTRPIFTGTEPRFETGLNRAIDLTGFDYAAVHYAPGSSGDPTFNRGGSLVFYHLRSDSYSFIFPQAGPGSNFSNGPITSVAPFFSVPIADAGNSALFFAIGLGGILLMSSQRALAHLSLKR